MVGIILELENATAISKYSGIETPPEPRVVAVADGVLPVTHVKRDG